MRADILRVVTKEMKIADFDPEEVADRTTGLTGSDLRMVLREAVLGALTEDRMTITQADVMEAVEDFEERDNLKNMDMIDGEGAEVLGETGSNDAHDHADHDHDHADEGSPDPARGAEPQGRTQD
jgi:SpoVK/Ycf46/Vps4 family AAA+-type ATPase